MSLLGTSNIVPSARLTVLRTDPRAVDPETQPFKVTDEHHARLCASVQCLSHLLDPSFRLPSRHALTRYMTSYFEGFHLHLPFIHSATWHMLNHPPELIFGLSAIGAQYCFEHRVSKRLFFAGKAILMDRLARQADRFGPRTRSFVSLQSPGSGRRASGGDGDDDGSQWPTIETIRAITALMGFATWEPEAYMVQEAFALQGLLAHVLRDTGLDEDDDDDGGNSASSLDSRWHSWIERESCRRSKLIAFSFLHTHSIAYNSYPVLRSNEVNLRLPCSTKEWKASSARQWQAASREAPKQQLYFQEALCLLLKKSKNLSAPLDPIPTPLGNYVLLHGLLQRIHIVRDLSLPVAGTNAALPSEEVETLE